MGLEDDFLLEDADDEKTVEFIKNYLPQELKEKFEDDELYYFLDLIDEYYSESKVISCGVRKLRLISSALAPWFFNAR